MHCSRLDRTKSFFENANTFDIDSAPATSLTFWLLARNMVHRTICFAKTEINLCPERGVDHACPILTSRSFQAGTRKLPVQQLRGPHQLALIWD